MLPVLTADWSQQAPNVIPHPAPRLHAREPAAHTHKQVLKFRCPHTRSKILAHAQTLPTPGNRSTQTPTSDETPTDPASAEHHPTTLTIRRLTSRNSEMLLEY